MIFKATDIAQIIPDYRKVFKAFFVKIWDHSNVSFGPQSFASILNICLF